MDRTAIKRVLIVPALAFLSGALVDDVPLRVARWTIAERQIETLTTEPAECLSVADSMAQGREVAIGRVAFRAPLLLGGQAARAGLSCNACHRGGRSNAGFFFPGLSGAPGTADVTSSIMSSHRGDGAFNPRPIPDLSAAKDRLAVDQDRASKRLERFITGLIVEEFDGPEPTPATVAGLAAYVRALSPAACPPGDVILDLAHDLRRIDDAVTLVAAVDPATAQLLVASARATMGVIEERYPGPRSHAAVARLRAASVTLGAIERRFATAPDAALTALADWRRDAERWRAPLRRRERASLYDRLQLSKRLPLTLAVTPPTD